MTLERRLILTDSGTHHLTRRDRKMAKPLPQQHIGVALIGAGMIAKTHLAALSNLQDTLALKAIVSTRPERARSLADLYSGPAPTFTSDIAAVASDPTIQIAIVATPPNVRKDIIETLAAAGTHILLEKPVGRTLAEAAEIVEICERAGVTLGVLFQHRMRAPAIAAARHVASGALGRLGTVEIEAPLWREQSYYDELGRGTYERDGGGVLLTNAIHSIDLALSLTGPLTSVQAMTATSPLHQMEAEDFAVVGLRFDNGAIGSLVASTAVFPHRTEVLRLHFDKASLRIDKDSLEISWRDGKTDIEAQSNTADTHSVLRGGKHEWHQAVIENFVNALKTGAAPMVSGREALRSHHLIAAIETSSTTGHSVSLSHLCP